MRSQVERLSITHCHSQTGEDRVGDPLSKSGLHHAVPEWMRSLVITSSWRTLLLGGIMLTWLVYSQFGPSMPGLVRSREFGSGGFFLPSGVAQLQSKVPKLPRYRLSLTALSQKYNLYFVAYGGKIYIYRPANVFRKIRSEPDCIIHLPKDNFSTSGGTGHVDTSKPNHVNHMIVGSLGENEILVTASDNGDVSAFYTSILAEHVYNRPTGGKSKVLDNQPRCLADNVQSSAWGLAVHAKSQLIAVSSNLADITIFAPAIQSRRDKTTGKQAGADDDSDVEHIVRKRDRDWRIVVVLPFQPETGNIPAITFLDDEDGFADKICCMDTKGQAWIAEIWKPKEPAMKCVQLAYNCGVFIGWGILALKESDFLSVDVKEGNIFGDIDYDSGYGAPCLKNLVDPPSHIFDSRYVYDTERGELQEPDSASDQGGASDENRSVSGLEGTHGSPLAHDVNDNVTTQAIGLPSDSANGNGVLYEDWDDIFDAACGSDSETTVAVSAQDDEEGVCALNLLTPPTGPAAADEKTTAAASHEEAKIELKYAINETRGLPKLVPGMRSFIDPRFTVVEVEPSSLSHQVPGHTIGLVYVPHLGIILRLLLPQSTFSFSTILAQAVRVGPPDFTDVFKYGEDEPRVPELSQYQILMAYENHFVMKPLRRRCDTSLRMDDVVIADDHDSIPIPSHFLYADRLSMLAHVRELNLVIIGSTYGRVTLMTPVCRAKTQQEKDMDYVTGLGFETNLSVMEGLQNERSRSSEGGEDADQPTRSDDEPGLGRTSFPELSESEDEHMVYSLLVEAILPSGTEDKLRPRHPLYGMAVGPVHRAPWKDHPMDLGGGGGERPAFRLMLHYRDFTILSWELRRGVGNKLEIMEL